MLDFRIHGAADMRAAARQLRIEHKALRAGAAKALERGVRGLRKNIAASASRLPSGYSQVMAADVKVSTSVRFGSVDPTIAVRVWAEGGPSKDHRDINAIDAGNLRHPVFGRRKDRWHDQAVRPGFASDPFAAMKPAILDEIQKEWDSMVSRVERG